MLQYIRDRATGWIAGGIVTLIIIPFALWGVYDYMRPSQSVAVATVNGRDIDYREFQHAYQQQRQQIRALLGGAVRPDLIDDETIREQAIERLVNDEVVLQVAEHGHMRIGDAQLAGAIDALPAFQESGAFSQPRYEGWLRSRGYSPVGFEHDLRRSMLIEQIASGVHTAAIVTDSEAERLARLAGQKREFSELRIPVADHEVEAVSDEEVRAHFDANGPLYMRPEQVRVAYLELSRADIAADIPVTESEIRGRYEAHKGNYITAEQREASHILRRLPPDADDAAVAAAKADLEKLRQRIEAGESFEAIAREHSDDPGSARQGGTLGFFGRGVMDPAFEAAVFAAPVGTVIGPVRSAFGMHLIEVTDVRPAVSRPYEEVAATIERELRDEQAEQIFYERAERLANLSFEHPQSLEVAAGDLGLEVRESAPITRSVADNEGLGESQRVVDAAFGVEVLEEGNNSALLELGDDRVVVLRVLSHDAARPRELDEVRDEVVAAVRRERAMAAVEALGRKVVDGLRAGEARAAAADEAGAEWSAAREVGRTAEDLAEGVADALFRMQRPQSGAPVYDGVTTAEGDFVVLELLAVTDGKPDDATGGAEAVRTALRSSTGQSEFDALLKGMRARAEVRISEQNLQQ